MKLVINYISLSNWQKILFQVRPGALTYEITETVNKLAQPKLRNNSEKFKYSSPSFLSMIPLLKPGN